MLYERWRRVAREFEGEIALRDLGSGESWTFGQLAKITEKADLPGGPVSFPSGMTVQFVFDILKAWRSGQVVCPLEPGQRAPAIPSIPPGVTHLKLTSATTGSHKLVAFTGAQLAADAEQIVQTMGLRPDRPNLGVISLAHSYGFSNLVTPLLLHGIPLIISNSALPETIRAASKAGKVALPAVPALWRTWHDAGVLSPSIDLAISAGAPLPIQLESAVFETSGIKIHNFYGATECGGIAYDRSSAPRTDGACAGSPLHNVTLGMDTEGRLEVRSAAVAEGYWPKRSPDLGKGLFRTSDMAEMSEGLIYLRGRATDQINIAGRKVFPDTIERFLLTHPQVRECVVFGVASSELERVENIVACVETDGSLTPAALREFALSRLPSWQVPRHWWLVPKIARNNRGKVSRAELRAAYLRVSGST
jgi:long-chain acyl-CoA synthetase